MMGDPQGLRPGRTTGTCAAAAAKAAALALSGRFPRLVEIDLPHRGSVEVPVAWARLEGSGAASAGVVKDAGDDIDATDGIEIEVRLDAGSDGTFSFRAGRGVGVVRRPGLQVAVGEPAINPVPRAQIRRAVESVAPDRGWIVTVSVPAGETIAARTFNPRLGIEGGISILGTSGRVEPKSEDAWFRGLLPQVDTALAEGHEALWIVPGRIGEDAARRIFGAPAAAVVHCSNFVGRVAVEAARRGGRRLAFVGHAGKVAKLAAGILDTHSRHGDGRLETIAALAGSHGAPGPLVARLLELPTAEEAIELLAGHPEVWEALCQRAARRLAERLLKEGAPSTRIDVAVVGYGDALLGATPGLAGVRPRDPATAPGTRRRVVVVGCGPGGAQDLTPRAWQALRRADAVAAAPRHLAMLGLGGETFALGADLEALGNWIRSRPPGEIAIAASGDPLCFGIAAWTNRALPDCEVRVLPGISSIQEAAARLGVDWTHWAVVSVHGRGEDDLRALQPDRGAFVLTGPAMPPEKVVALHPRRRAWIGVRLGMPEEVVRDTQDKAIGGERFDPLAVVALFPEDHSVESTNRAQAVSEDGGRFGDVALEGNDEGLDDAGAKTGESRSGPAGGPAAGPGCEAPSVGSSWALEGPIYPGIPDAQFLRGDAPMTKSEIRALSLCRLRPGPGLHVLDIGAGTGSVAIEAALLGAEVVAVEREAAAARLVRANAERLGVGLRVIEGSAPDAIPPGQDFDRIFLGGSGGRLPAILADCAARLAPGGWFVANTICLGTTQEIATLLAGPAWCERSLVQVSVARAVPVGRRDMRFEAQSPVWIHAARRAGDGESA